MSKYAVLKEYISDWIYREEENFKDAKEAGGVNCVGAGMALGAIDAYRQVLADISELEKEATYE